ncbi:MAG: TIGR03943 family protein [Caldilineaceae bacterium]
MDISNPRLQNAFKSLALFGLAIFLYTRIVNGTLLFYINQRFAWLTLAAAIGLVLVAVSYQPTLFRAAGRADAHDADAHDADDTAHEHTDHEHAGHDHSLRWSGLLIVILPVALGILVPPRPLGVSALATREVNVGAPSGMPAAIRTATEKMDGDKNILDWAYEFQAADLAQVPGREANVIGFVYKDEQFGANAFSVARYVVSCCVADAAYAGLLVQWPDVAALENDQWVRVVGHFELTEKNGQTAPILIAKSIEITTQPNQPYLYP